MSHESIGDNLHDAFNCENDQEDIFHFFLHQNETERKSKQNEWELLTSIDPPTSCSPADRYLDGSNKLCTSDSEMLTSKFQRNDRVSSCPMPIFSFPFLKHYCYSEPCGSWS